MNRINSFGMAGMVVLGLVLSGCSKSENPFITSVDEELGATLTSVRANMEGFTTELETIGTALDGLQNKDLELRAQYESFKKSAAEMKRVAEDLKLNRVAVNQACTSVLEKWQAGLDGLSDKKMRKRSTERLEDAIKEQKELDQLMQKGDKMIDLYTATLTDISKYLDLELSEDSVKSVSDAFKRARKSGNEINKWIEELLAELADLEKKFSV